MSIKDQWTAIIDCRGGIEDRTVLAEPNTFTKAVFETKEGEIPVGEVLTIYRGHELSIVGELTGREGVLEVTPEHIKAAARNTGYHHQLVTWLKGLEA